MVSVTSQIESALENLEPPSCVADHTTRAAMKFMVGYPVGSPQFEPSKKPYDRYLFESVSKAWIQWASLSKKDLDEALCSLRSLRDQPPGASGALHLMALDPWRGAVEALLSRDADTARKFFLRASELGSELGTESSPTVQWTFAASFFFSSIQEGR